MYIYIHIYIYIYIYIYVYICIIYIIVCKITTAPPFLRHPPLTQLAPPPIFSVFASSPSPVFNSTPY